MSQTHNRRSAFFRGPSPDNARAVAKLYEDLAEEKRKNALLKQEAEHHEAAISALDSKVAQQTTTINYLIAKTTEQAFDSDDDLSDRTVCAEQLKQLGEKTHEIHLLNQQIAQLKKVELELVEYKAILGMSRQTISQLDARLTGQLTTNDSLDLKLKAAQEKIDALQKEVRKLKIKRKVNFDKMSKKKDDSDHQSTDADSDDEPQRKKTRSANNKKRNPVGLFDGLPPPKAPAAAALSQSSSSAAAAAAAPTSPQSPRSK